MISAAGQQLGIGPGGNNAGMLLGNQDAAEVEAARKRRLSAVQASVGKLSGALSPAGIALGLNGY